MRPHRYALAAALIAVGGLTACTAGSADDAAPTPDAIDIASLCQNVEANTTALDVINDVAGIWGAPDTVEQKNRTTCAEYRAGIELAQLRNLPVIWDQQCLEGAGWTLSENQAPVQLNGTPGHYYPAEAAHCASPVVTPEVCESVREALAPQQAALNYETASVITKLGCTNIEVQMPS